MRAWAREAGENFDLKIADRLTRSAIDRLVSTTLPARHALLINLGDFFHADDNSARTPEHGNKLDVDGRYDLVLTTGALCLVHCVQWLLERHEEVTVWSLPGNHDPHSALALSLALKMFFHNEPRVNIEVDPSLFRFLRFGRNLIGATHGHGPKIADLPSIMADERPEDWGKTEHRVWWVGHFHNRKAWEMRGCDIQIARTLASADAWHASKGYKAMREVRSVVYHYDHGEWQQQRVSPGMIAAGV
jgi:DNA repair exonuclease SbcCD nuclease subunit